MGVRREQTGTHWIVFKAHLPKCNQQARRRNENLNVEHRPECVYGMSVYITEISPLLVISVCLIVCVCVKGWVFIYL